MTYREAQLKLEEIATSLNETYYSLEYTETHSHGDIFEIKCR